MALKTCPSSTSPVSRSANRKDDRAQAVLALQAAGAGEGEQPVLLEGARTQLSITRSTHPAAGSAVVLRSALGWNLRAEGVECRLNGAPVEDAWLYDGDRLSVADREFVVRPATTAELLGQVPQTRQPARAADPAAVTEQSLAVAACERDLAEWEQCLLACEADLRLRALNAPRGEPAIDDAGAADRAALAELQELRTDPTAFDADARRLQTWLTTLREERAALECEQARLAVDRARLTRPASLAADETTTCDLAATIAVPAIPREALKPVAPVPQTPQLAEKLPELAAGPIGMEWHRPRRNLEQSRMRLNRLRLVANHSTRRALRQHFWKQHRSAVALKAALVAMSFALACVLYWHHGAFGSSISGMVWGAAAIGIITLSGLVHTWTEVKRFDGDECRPIDNAPSPLADAEGRELAPGL